MTTPTPLDGFAWWAQHIGRHLTPDRKPPSDASLLVPTRAKKGLTDMRIGAIDLFYAGTQDQALIIGRLTFPDMPGLKNVAVEDHSARQEIAKWLVHEARDEFMVGVITKSNPERYMTVSRAGAPAVFCSAGSNMQFDLGRLRDAKRAFEGLPWKKVTQAIYLARDLRAGGPLAATARERYLKLCEKTPGLGEAISGIDLPAGGGEHRLLGWYYSKPEPASVDATEAA